jgi:hypothetical protein
LFLSVTLDAAADVVVDRDLSNPLVHTGTAPPVLSTWTLTSARPMDSRPRSQPTRGASDVKMNHRSFLTPDANLAAGHDRGFDMGRGNESANKRRVTAQRNDRKAVKKERRQQRRDEKNLPPADQDAIMSRFHQLNELRSTGAITEDDFEHQRHEIFVFLGLEDP